MEHHRLNFRHHLGNALTTARIRCFAAVLIGLLITTGHARAAGLWVANENSNTLTEFQGKIKKPHRMLKDTADLLQIFETVLDIPPARVSLILNHPRPQTMVTRADAERVVKRPMHMEIAYDGARFDRAAVMGEVLVASEPSSAVAKTLTRLASSISDEHRGRASKRS